MHPPPPSSPAILSDWELLAKEGNCTVYRKPYQDTELFQFKVIGRYDDITAKDYFDVQVCVYCTATLMLPHLAVGGSGVGGQEKWR